MTPPLLILRPEPGGARTAAQAQARGLAARCYPLFLVAPLPWTGPEPHLVDAVMFTSANGARLAGAQLGRYTHLPAFAVGDATAQAASAAGFATVYAGAQGVQALADRIAAAGHRHILHISGRDIRAFDPGGLRILSACTYAAVECGNAQDLAALLVPGTVMLVHSPRAGERLAALVPSLARAALHVVAISPPALAACGPGWAIAIAAATPDDEAMLALAARLCEGMAAPD